ncbi:MAG: carboxypeptidase-like regulatory domain-containing protein [Minicystis sp.]
MSRLAAAALLLATALLPGAAIAQPAPPPLRVHVRGGAEVHAVAGSERGEITIRGELIDDAGAAIANAPVVVTATAEGTHAPLKLGPLSPCEGSSARGAGRGGDEAVIETDDRGGFCATGRAPAEKLVLKLKFRGSKLYDTAEMEVPVTAETERLQRALLRFEPPPETIDLDRETVTVTAALRVERSELFRPSAAGSAQRASLPLVLEDERHAHVAEAVTGGDGRARFEVKTSALAGPGAGELVVRFGGNAVLGKAEDAKPIVRRAEARLALEHPIDPADPEDGVPIDIVVTTSRGPVSGGVVEVRRAVPAALTIAGDSLGAGTVDEHGHARVVAAFAAAGATKVPLLVRYVPAAPWYRAGPELRVEVEVKGPGILRQVLLAAVVIGAAVWVASGWRRAPRPRELPGVDGATAPPSGRAGVQVIASPPDLAGWRGTVADAHDGSPIAGASLAIVAPSFQGDGTVGRTTADERGAFTLEGAYRNDARLVVTSPDHATHEQALPPPSVLRVALITRRRAILERLVRWARQRGAPFDGAPEPTPGHVRRAAARASVAEVEAWAGHVEQAVYGPERVDEAREREIRGAEPRAAR